MSDDTDDVRHLFSAAEAEHTFGIPAATIRAWASRHRLWCMGLDAAGRPLYDREDLLALRRRLRRLAALLWTPASPGKVPPDDGVPGLAACQT